MVSSSRNVDTCISSWNSWRRTGEQLYIRMSCGSPVVERSREMSMFPIRLTFLRYDSLTELLLSSEPARQPILSLPLALLSTNLSAIPRGRSVLHPKRSPKKFILLPLAPRSVPEPPHIPSDPELTPSPTKCPRSQGSIIFLL